MARRSDHTREELKGLAIRKGIEILEKDGMAGFSARKVASAMGYAVGTLYHVFGSLEAYMLHLHADTLDALHDEVTHRLARQKGDRLQPLALCYIDFARKHYNRWSALFEHRTDGDAMPDWYTEKYMRLFALIEEALLPHLNGDTKKARAAARVLWAGIHGICVLSLSGKLEPAGAEKPEKMAAGLITTYLQGLQAG